MTERIMIQHTSYPFWFDDGYYYATVVACRSEGITKIVIDSNENIDKFYINGKRCRYTEIIPRIPVDDPYFCVQLISEIFRLTPDETGVFNQKAYVIIVPNNIVSQVTNDLPLLLSSQ
ncbi:hypothetical protein [Trichoplusia ni ascovirus 2c]|uniref:hypothetical protein n=1 Tax=Trichoplusia ni ascovirus 2c TaxID=328615 RepID=UPI0000E44247|nr:hypothetical protein TNAV2c_gp111 [Trichoplusia ni ascovirus 2c]ABF70628.1 hypothetical protein [Trichoplusia ni ascovirus 2c]